MTIMNLLASAVLAGGGVALALAAVEAGTTWLLVLSAALAAAGLWMMARSAMMRISYDSETLRVVGLFRSHRIPRTAVLEIERWDLERPMVRWVLPGSADQWTALSPLALKSSPFLPRSMYLRRHRFLAQLRLWAPDASTDDVRPGFRTRSIAAIGRVAVAVWESPALRVVLALALTATAAASWLLGWNETMAVVEGRAGFSRGVVLGVFFAGFALEGAYLLLPLKRRRPRVWHVILGAILAPLVALLLIAVFG
ncbi:hypothetical protein Q9R08_11055 [Microbacterium sp. QXD-8]|uniref:PH domain-containing protein n=1 Tax=Microbacterium psychrotolerans TaxID=3068321 RepID=A0ABU0Z1R2_9MICO|nr:hypothetical protein [Microbacterium sp. QXD-8]MDQ7878514.1 hypothetical protein [Microbacterium sp. QXD-8]